MMANTTGSTPPTDPETPANGGPETVPESLAPVARPPRRVSGLWWLLSPVVWPVAVLFPAWLGPRLARAMWWLPVVWYLAGCILVYSGTFQVLAIVEEWDTRYRWPMTASQWVRMPLAWAWEFAMLRSDEIDWEGVGQVVALIVVFPWVAGLIITPWIAAGERAGRTYLRAVRLVLWGTPLLAACPITLYWLDDPGLRLRLSDTYKNPMLAVAGLTLLLWLRTVLRWGQGYAGRALGPGFERRTVRCEGCGYRLALLPVAGRCPECGRAVAESLPQRSRPALAMHRNPFIRLVGYVPTLLRSWRGRRFASTTAIYANPGGAREFAALTCVLAGLALLPVYPLRIRSAYFAYVEYFGPRFGATLDAIDYAVVGVETWLLGVLAAAALLALAALLATWGGLRRPVRGSVVVAYSSGYLLPVAGLVTLGLWAGYLIFEVGGVYLGGWRPRRDIYIPLDLVVFWALLLPAFTVLVLWIWHLRKMLRATRFANA
jgi:hypothetical protein